MAYIYSFAWRTLQERWQTTVLFQAKFRVSASEISLIIANFLWATENSKKYRPLFQRIFARNAANFRSNFGRKLSSKVRENKEQNSCNFTCITFAQYCTVAQLVEDCTGITEVMGSNPVQAWIFFRLSFRNCLTAFTYSLFFHSSNVWIFIYSLSFQLSVHPLSSPEFL